MKQKSWTHEQLRQALESSKSIRQILKKLGLKEAGGNYVQIKNYIKLLKLNTKHLTGKGWRKGSIGWGKPKILLTEILIRESSFQTFKLKQRLFKAGLKKPRCEECGWSVQTEDGRIPVELDHINGNSTDNRIENLRILCPNCHSLKPTHRGRNKKVQWRNRYTRST